MIADLLPLLPPPRPPAPIDWADAERRMGTPLPSDVKALVDRYGPGHLAGVIELLSPVEPRSRRNLVATARDEAAAHLTSPSHLLALARDADGVPLLWQMLGPPDEWPILVGADLWRFEGTLSELLLAALTGRAPLPMRDGPPPPEPEPDEVGVPVTSALAAVIPRPHDPRALDRLTRTVPPPPSPAPWSGAPGAPVPRDFRALTDRYGGGAFGELVLLDTERIAWALDAARQLQRLYLDPVTDEPAYRVWPQPDGLLPWADLMASVSFHWYTGSGSPDDWTVVVEETDAGRPAFWAFDGTATEVVLGIVDGSLDVPALRDWDLGDSWAFQPFR